MTMPDLRLYGLIDPENTGGHDLGDLATAMCAGGVTLIQLRDKKSDTGDFVRLARLLREKLLPHKVPLLINDRVDVAIAARADGVHLGQDDLAVADARAMLGEDALIGLTVRSQSEADEAPVKILDYIALGGVFATTSKDNKTKPIGLAGLRDLSGSLRARRADLALCAIAGINVANAADVVAAGADGVAVISALSGVPDPTAAARQFRDVIDLALQKQEAS